MEKTKGNTNSPDIYNSFRLKKLKVVFEEKMQGKEISVYCMEESRLQGNKTFAEFSSSRRSYPAMPPVDIFPSLFGKCNNACML